MVAKRPCHQDRTLADRAADAPRKGRYAAAMTIHPLAGLLPVLPDPTDETGLLYVGGRISESAILAAYPLGLFPWTGAHPIPWCSPDPRAVLAPETIPVRRSLAKRIRNGSFVVRSDTCLPAVIAACRDAPRPGQGGTWITPNLEAAWTGLWHRGLAHSVEVFREGALVGGLYGLALGRAFFGESMFHRERDASKVALVALCRLAAEDGLAFIDCQAMTPHLASMGAKAVSRGSYLQRLAAAVAEPRPPGSWAGRTIPALL